ncbi:MAG: hypothetical protein FWD66_10740 [Paludibacter sp.]|nr:hypothetical protein [Paludibacter sp.]
MKNWGEYLKSPDFLIGRLGVSIITLAFTGSLSIPKVGLFLSLLSIIFLIVKQLFFDKKNDDKKMMAKNKLYDLITKHILLCWGISIYALIISLINIECIRSSINLNENCIIFKWWAQIIIPLPFIGLYSLIKLIMYFFQLVKEKQELETNFQDLLSDYGLLEDVKKKRGEIKEKYYDNNTQTEKRITHLLSHIMYQQSLSFADVIKADHIGNLNAAFAKSISIAEKLTNNKESYAWFSNMILPETYAEPDNAVHDYYKKLLNAFTNKDLIKIRRIHLLYRDSVVYDNVQIIKLFTTLLVEYFMDIESKVIIIENFEDCKEKIFHFKEGNIKTSKGYLLDFALFYDKNETDDFFQNHNLLFADFCHQRIDDKINYNEQGVYHINDYNTFNVIKAYYLSLWEKDNYVKYLFNLLQKDLKENVKEDIQEITNLYSKHFTVVDFFQFWKETNDKINLHNLTINNVFNVWYNWDKYKGSNLFDFDSNDSELARRLLDKFNNFFFDKETPKLHEIYIDNKVDDIKYITIDKEKYNELKTKFDNEFKQYFIRIKRT